MVTYTVNNYRTDKPNQAGLGGQLYHLIVGYLVDDAGYYEQTYAYNPMKKFRFPGDEEFVPQDELDRTNEAIHKMMKEAGVPLATEETTVVPVHPQLCDEYCFEGLKKLTWPMENPYKECPDLILTIHIRTGPDVIGKPEFSAFMQPVEYYNQLIRKCMKLFPKYMIQVIAWGDPGLADDIKNKVMKLYSSSGYSFIDDFNRMVHSDILIVANSSFSMAAGLLNKNTVICDNSIIGNDPYPKSWDDNYRRLIK